MNYSDKYNQSLKILCDEYKKNNYIEPSLYERYHIKRGLRNPDGSGVMAGITNICCVHGYIMSEGEKAAIEGELIYRGYNIKDLVAGRPARYGYEEIVYLLLFGQLPTKSQLESFTSVLAESRELPDGFFIDHILKTPSKNIMNKMASSLLTLYTYDENPEDVTMLAEIQRAMQIIARMPRIMVNAYSVKRNVYDRESLIMHLNNLKALPKASCPAFVPTEVLLPKKRRCSIYA